MTDKIKSWDEIQDNFDRMQRMSCIPVGIRKVQNGHVFDEDQSVKWNKEQVEINNRKYKEEVARLNTLKNKARDSVHEDIYKHIQREVGHDLSRDKAIAIWAYAYDQGHAYGITEVKHYLDEIMEVVKKSVGVMNDDESND